MERCKIDELRTTAFHLDISNYLLENFCRKLSNCSGCPYPNLCDFNMKLLELEKTIDNEKII